MKKINIIGILLLCCVHIGWIWQKSKDQEYMQKGYEAWQAGDFNEAIVAYENVLSLKPRNVDAYNFLGVVYEEIGYPQKAEEKYLLANKINPDYLPVYLNLGLLYWNKGDLEKASYYFKKRVEKGRVNDPWTQKAMKALATIKEQQGKVVGVKTIDMSHENEPKSRIDVKSKDAGHQYHLKFVNQELDKFIKTNPSNKEVLKGQVNQEQAIKEQSNSINEELKVVSENEQKVQALLAQGQRLASSGKYQEAIEAYDQALKLVPGNSAVVKARVDAYLRWKEQAMNLQ